MMDRIEAAARALAKREWELRRAFRTGMTCESYIEQFWKGHTDEVRTAIAAADDAAAPPSDAVELELTPDEARDWLERLDACSETLYGWRGAGSSALRDWQRMRAALDAAGPWQGWQPIETAPEWMRGSWWVELGELTHRSVTMDDGRIAVILYDNPGGYPVAWRVLPERPDLPLPPPPGSASPAPEGEARACTSDDVSERVDQPDSLAEAVELLGSRLEMAGVKPRSAANFDAETIITGIADYAVETAEERVIGPIRSKIRDEVKRALRDPEVRAELFSDEQPPE